MSVLVTFNKRWYFNPRPPWGGRPGRLNDTDKFILFQSTPSVGRATMSVPFIVALAVFQSTPSVGRATAKIYKYAILCLCIIHIKLYIFATAVLFI